MRTLIKDGTVVTAVDTYKADVWIENGIITGLTHPAQRAQYGEAQTVIDAAGKYVLPGGIDAVGSPPKLHPGRLTPPRPGEEWATRRVPCRRTIPPLFEPP